MVHLFNVSSAAIRSDLRELNDKGHIIRTHGGAIIETGASFEPDTWIKLTPWSSSRLTA